MRLGDLIDRLGREPIGLPVYIMGAHVLDHELNLMEKAIPGSAGYGGEPQFFTSYRGYYEQLALQYDNGNITRWDPDKRESVLVSTGRLVRVGELLAAAQEAVGKTFEGYKGGDYVMREDTPVWVANGGESTSLAITEAVRFYDTIVIRCTDISDYA